MGHIKMNVQAGKVNKECKSDGHKHPRPCPKLSGTVIRVFIPAGAVINFGNIMEVTSPSRTYLIVRLPILGWSRKWSRKYAR